MVKTAGRSFGRKKNYGLTVTVSSKPCDIMRVTSHLETNTSHGPDESESTRDPTKISTKTIVGPRDPARSEGSHKHTE
jgi:hypothetical protein